MISCLFISCRLRRPALRAALVTLTIFSGCQGSLRSWRRDDPSIRDLVVTPHPWDEPTRRDENMRSDLGNREHDSYAHQNRKAAANSGRANPYANSAKGERGQFAAADETAQSSSDDELNFEVEDAALKSIIGDADPRHRAMLVLQYQAMKNNRRHDQAPAGEAEGLPDEGDYEERVDDAHEHPQYAQTSTNAKRSPKSKRPAQSDVNTAGFAMVEDEGNQVRTASATRKADRDDLGNHEYMQAEDEPVHYSLSDSSEDYDAQPRPVSRSAPPKSKAKLQEMKPPAKLRDDRRTVREPVANTGYEEQFDAPRTGGPREDSSTSSRRRSQANPSQSETGDEVDAHYTDQTQVVQASAESSLSSTDLTDSLNQPIIRPSARSSSRNSASHSEQAPPKSTASPTEAQTDEDWRELAQKTLRALEQEPIDSSATAQLNHHVTKRILFVLLGQLDQALEPIPGLQPHEQEYFRHNLQALYNSIDPRGNPVLSRRWPLVMDDHRTAMSHLGAVSNLEVKNAAFCSNVDGFGAVTKFPTYQFRPNQQLLLYCEVENFVSEQIKDGYETKLRGNYEIVDANQTRVADFILPEEVDMCKRPRRDYFFVYRIYTPQHIAPGRYQLRLTIEDMKGNKFGQTSLDMQINAQ